MSRGRIGAPRRKPHVLATVLFTDIVGSTSVAAEMGDARWNELVGRHHRLTRDALARFGGRERDTAGDGFFATFEGPSDAVRAAVAIVHEVRAIGLEIRAGIHFGETEAMHGKPGGMAVVIASRVMSLAGPGEVLLTTVTRDVASGLRLEADDLGARELSGVPGTWELLRVQAIDGQVVDPVLDPGEARRRRDEVHAPRRRKRRARVLAAVVVPSIGALVVAGIVRGDGVTATGLPPDGTTLRNAVVRIDPVAMTAERVATVAAAPEGSRLSATLAIGEGSVWVMDTALHRIDPVSGAVLEETEWTGSYVQVAPCCGAVWLARGLHFVTTPRPGLIRISVATGTISDDIAFPRGPTDVAVTDLAAAGSTVAAVLSDGRVATVEAGSLQVSVTALGGVLTSIAIRGDEMLVADAGAGAIIRLDRRTLRELRRFVVGGDPAALAIGEGSAWAVVPASGTLEEVDLATGRIDTYQVGPSPSDVAVGLGAVWVSDLQDGTVRRIDPSTGAVLGLVDLGVPVRRVVVDELTGAVWVTTLAAP